MQQIMNGYRGVSLLVNINWDRLLCLGTLAIALYFGAYIASL